MAPPGTHERINALIDQGQWAQAESMIRRAMMGERQSIDLAALMSFVLLRQARLAQAEFFARQVAVARPDDPYSLHNLGNILVNLGRFEDGLPFLKRALSRISTQAQIHQAYALGLIGLNRFTAASAAVREGLRLCPEDPRLLNLQAYVLQVTGRVEEAVPILRRALELDPNNPVYVEHMASMASYAPGFSEQEVFQASVRYGELENARYGPARTWTPAEVRARLKKGGPLHVGLISPDLRQHAVSFLIESFLEHADPSRVLVSCYSAASTEDEVSARLKRRVHRWRTVHNISVNAAAAMVQADRIDVLIDLAGHTNGNRLNVLTKKPAPVQMTYMGFPSTTGLAAVDYRIVDSITDPPGDDSLATERLLRLEPCFLSYRPPEDAPPVSPLPSADGAPVTFAAFSAVLKFNTPMLEMWARVLKAVPGSRLLLKHHAFKDEEVRADVHQRLTAAGADPALLTIMPPEPTAREVLPWYQKVDISLDTFPYNGTTTYCESFLMGVPMVSLRGRTPPARVGLSLLTAVGLQDLSAKTEDEFVAIAAALANDRPRLTKIRATLRDTFLKSSICDGLAFARRMTDACAWAMEQAGRVFPI